MFQIDGSILEGGGQILRNCVAFSAILNKKIVISNIRGNRAKPGLKFQHLTGLNLVKVMCNAKTSGIEKDSMQVEFEPNKTGISSGNFTANIPSAGSCTLLSQISLPVALYAPGLTRFILTGGTNVPMSPPAQFLEHVLLPTLHKFNPRIRTSMNVTKHGFMPLGGGSIEMTVDPLKKGFTLNPIVLLSKGTPKEIKCYLSGYCTKQFVENMEQSMKDNFNHSVPTEYIPNVELVPTDKGQVSLTVVLETDNGCLLSTTILGGRKTTSERMSSIVKKRLEWLCKKDICVDEYLQDQLIIFMALANGTSQIKSGKPTLHTKTAIHFAQMMTGASFSIQEYDHGENYKDDKSDENDKKGDDKNDKLYIISCKGIGFVKQ